MRIHLTESALAQIEDVLSCIRDERPGAADRIMDRLEDSLYRLERYPASGRLIPEYPTSPYREILVHPLRIFYRIDQETVCIVAAWHHAQLVEPP
jgi:plasmid stabilization system protein ParE